jgi:hypothetical protein
MTKGMRERHAPGTAGETPALRGLVRHQPQVIALLTV